MILFRKGTSPAGLALVPGVPHGLKEANEISFGRLLQCKDRLCELSVAEAWKWTKMTLGNGYVYIYILYIDTTSHQMTGDDWLANPPWMNESMYFRTEDEGFFNVMLVFRGNYCICIPRKSKNQTKCRGLRMIHGFRIPCQYFKL